MISGKGEPAVKTFIREIFKVSDVPGSALRKKAKDKLAFARLYEGASQFSYLNRRGKLKGGLGSSRITGYYQEQGNKNGDYVSSRPASAKSVLHRRVFLFVEYT